MKCLFIQVRYSLKSGCRDDFYQRFRDNNIREMSLTEEGNIEYELYMPQDSGNDVCLLEKWESLQAHEKHMHTLHYAILCELKAKYVKKVEIKKYWLTDFEDAEVEDIKLR
ncbi:antibiotic biosynthesis monooxygenase family protein [Treponema sp.]|uniref:antibiotic biosynthesis monooxygenase family protein n=1 Tax=Treponema sp. TaxID=166 RepID=UPI003890D65F